MKRWAAILFLTVPAWGEALSLPQALAAVEKLSPAVQEARLRVLEQEALALVERSGLGPQLNVSIGGSYQTTNLQGIGLTFPGVPSRVGPYGVFDARPRLSQTVLDLGMVSRWRAAQQRTGQLHAEAGTVMERTREAVIDLYLQALMADSQARAGAARVETAKAVLAQTKDAEQAGTANKLDLSRAAQVLETEQARLVLLKRDRDSVVTLLKRTIGVRQEPAIELVDVKAAEMGTFSLEQALEARPEMRALAAKQRALSEEKRAAERERWPKVGAFGDYGVLGQSPVNAVSTYAVGGSLNVPVWTSGRIENGIKAARLRLDQWEQEKRALELQVEQELVQARQNREAAQEALGSAARATVEAREALELARLRYGAGLATNLDVVTAQGNVAETEEQEIRTRYEGLLAGARLARAGGDVMAFVRGR